jgi:hypothetical protein
MILVFIPVININSRLNPKLYIFLFFALGASLGVFAQIPNIDSLKSVLPATKGEERLTVLNELSPYLREVEQQVAFDYAEEAEKLAQSLNNKSGEAKAKKYWLDLLPQRTMAKDI